MHSVHGNAASRAPMWRICGRRHGVVVARIDHGDGSHSFIEAAPDRIDLAVARVTLAHQQMHRSRRDDPKEAA